MRGKRIAGARLAAGLVLIGMALGCGATATPQPAPHTLVPTRSPTATAIPRVPTRTAEPTATEGPSGPESVRVPEIASTDSRVIYEQDQRVTLGGHDMMFWPDGNIGFVPTGDGRYRFFAANGSVTARTVGTFDDPAATVETSNLRVEGASTEFAYLAGGPVYRDPASGMLILFYHAERHFGGSGMPFHAAIGLAASHDDGQTFQDLGIILETNAEPDVTARCCADMGGATFTIKDGMFYLYSRDRSRALVDINLALATAPVDEVVRAAQAGETSEWTKYSVSGPQPGIGGLPSALEIGNPQTSWFGVSYNTTLDQFIMAVSRSTVVGEPSELYLIASEDGIHWSPRVLLESCDCELTYPTIIDPGGNLLETGDTFYIYYVTTPSTETYRWHNTPLRRMTVTLTGEMVELPHDWEFNSDTEGWTPLNQIGTFEVVDGALVVEPTGNDPYMQSPPLGLSSTEYTTIEVRMKTSRSGNGQFFFIGSDVPGISEAASVRFPITGSGEFETYTVDMSRAAGWSGIIGSLRFDPTDQPAHVDIDYIRVLP